MVDVDTAMRRGADSLLDVLGRLDDQLQRTRLVAKRQENELLAPVYAQRDKAIALVPGFWRQVLGSLAELKDLLGDAELDLLRHLHSLRITTLGGVGEADWRFELVFAAGSGSFSDAADQPTKLTRDFIYDDEAVLQGPSTAIPWRDAEHDLSAMASRDGRQSFFDLFAFQTPFNNESDDAIDASAQLEDALSFIKGDVYPNALDHFAAAMVSADEPEPSEQAKLVGKGKARADDDISSSAAPVASGPAMVGTAPQVSGGKTQNLAGSGAQLEQYCSSRSTALHANLVSHRAASIAAFGELLMVTTLEAQWLSFLTASHGVRSVLEIGCYTGYSALVFAHAGAEHVLTTGLDPAHASFARDAVAEYGLQDVITIHEGDAHQIIADETKVSGHFDLIFIDAEKEGYLAYLATVLDRGLLAPNGLIVADNTLRRGHVAMTDAPGSTTGGTEAVSSEEAERKQNFERGVRAIKNFNDAVAKDDRLEQVILPVFDGVSIIRYRR